MMNPRFSFRRWWRSSGDEADIQFDRYLDDRVSGETSAEIPGRVLPVESRDRLQELTGAAQQVFSLEAGAGRSRAESPYDKEEIWRKMMDAVPASVSDRKSVV